MELVVSGNINYFVNQPNSIDADNFVSFKVAGDFGTNYHISPYQLFYNNIVIGNLNWYDLTTLANKIRGCDYEDTFSILGEFNIVYTRTRAKTFQEIGLIKALFNILIWIEHDLKTLIISSLEKNIFDEFVLDYTGKRGNQQDIFFIPKRIKEDVSTQKSLNILEKLNLLCKVEINNFDVTPISNYFIPFYKPGVNIEEFIAFDKEHGEQAYKFFRSLLQYRENRIKKFVGKNEL